MAKKDGIHIGISAATLFTVIGAVFWFGQQVGIVRTELNLNKEDHIEIKKDMKENKCASENRMNSQSMRMNRIEQVISSIKNEPLIGGNHEQEPGD
jgi:hypothetical protein